MITRNGKIARLPREIRVQLNRRIRDGEPQNRLVEWLNSLPEVQAVLAAEFGGRPINEPNLSDWKSGGYRDWLLMQEAVELVRHMDADADELSNASNRRVTDLLAQRVAAQYVLVAKQLNRSGAEDPGEIDLKQLREFCGDIVALRKGDHSAERLKLERERLEHEREQLRELREEEFRAWAEQNRELVCEGYKPRAMRDNVLRRILDLPVNEPGNQEDTEFTNGEGI